MLIDFASLNATCKAIWPKKGHYFRVGSELTVFCVISLTFITKGTKNIGQKQCIT